MCARACVYIYAYVHILTIKRRGHEFEGKWAKVNKKEERTNVPLSIILEGQENAIKQEK